jgi:cell division protein FtsA
VPETDEILIEAFGAERQRTYARRRVCEIIQARVEEILELTIVEVKRATELELVSAGMVLTGGTARLPNIDRLAEQVTGIPARVGMPNHIFGLVDELHDPAFATSVGLLQWAVGAQELAPLSRDVGGPTALDNVFKKISSWVRVLLPE